MVMPSEPGLLAVKETAGVARSKGSKQVESHCIGQTTLECELRTMPAGPPAALG